VIELDMKLENEGAAEFFTCSSSSLTPYPVCNLTR
jgi:hypothetical protein